MNKICVKCNQEKEINNFIFIKRSDKYETRCRECINRYQNIWRDKRRIFKEKQIDIDNRLGYKVCSTCNCKKGLDKFRMVDNNERYSAQCKICFQYKTKEYRINHKEQLNRLEIRQRRYEYIKRRRKTEPNYNLLCIIRHNIVACIKKRDDTKKLARSIELLGADIEFVRKYLESLFKPGMTWENHGVGKEKWQIDHKICAEVFNFLDIKQQLICFNYKNLQPLWWDENNRKADYLIDGRRARDLSPQEKLDYLKNLGYDL